MQPWDEGQNVVAKRGNSALLQPIERPLRNDIPALPVVAAVEHDEALARIKGAQDLFGVGRPPGDAHPQDIDR